MSLKFKYSVLYILLLNIVSLLSAQDKNTHLIIKSGNADYNAAIGNFGGGGASYNEWNLGPQFALGLEKDLTKAFSFQGLFTFSIHSFDERWSWGEKVNKGYNKVFDLMGNLKLNLWKFFIIGGIGFSYQNGDEIRYLEPQGIIMPGGEIIYSEPPWIKMPAKDKFVFAGLLGFGLDIYIYRNFSFLAEIEINMREYMGTSSLLGIKYTL